MSNSVVGGLYRDVIEEVINVSRSDFEDSGVEATILHELQEIWQKRLSSTRVARMPWDPEEPIQQEIVQDDSSQPPNQSSSSTSNHNTTNPLKQEDIVEGTYSGNPTLAAMRAVQQIQQFSQTNKGVEPDESIKAVMRRGGLDEASLNQQQQHSPTENNNNNNSNNGGFDDNDTSSGIMLPGGGRLSQMDGVGDILKRPARRRQMDGVNDDDDDDDSDAINSELDDSDVVSNDGEDDESEEGGMMMLCLYEKVGRVKTKWKCVMKDGIVNVNGKDYVFARGTGEFEW